MRFRLILCVLLTLITPPVTADDYTTNHVPVG
jgi:hypothetical protein